MEGVSARRKFLKLAEEEAPPPPTPSAASSSSSSGESFVCPLIRPQKPQKEEEDENVLSEKTLILLQTVREGIIGGDEVFKGPYGERLIQYCDYTASGKALDFIERYIQQEVLTMYANTHTGTSITGLQTSLFRSEARMIIERAINAHNKAGTDKDILVFTGSGATGAITKLVQILGLTRTTHTVVEKDRPVVFVGPYEHHSNLLPWRESICEVVEIEESNDGTGAMDLADLERKLVQYTDRKLKMGSFSAASNVTGILTDTNKVSALLHKYGALAFWDYASAAPYVKIDMNPVVPGPEGHLVHKDAIFISPHKFIGGVATPGILVAKKRLFSNKVPSCPGGGTVFFVTDKDHRYVKERVEREEGGTPDIVGSIRAALTFQLKEAIGTQAIQHLENKYCEMAMTSWKNNPNIYLLGSLNAHRLPIMSFMIVCEDRFLHYHFIAILLNDLFGIQARGGCACAGPYAQALLGIDYPLAKKLEKMLLAKDEHEFVRPGFVRLNFHYAMTEKEVQYVIDAVNFVAEHGWKFLSHYTFYPETGEWVHQHNKKFLERRWLGSITYRNGAMEYPSKHKSLDGGEATKEESFERYLNEAKLLAESISEEYSESGSSIKSRKETSQTGAKQKAIEQSLILDDEEDKLRWFMLPAEAIRRLQARNNDVSFSSVSHLLGMSPFKPNDFLDRVTELIQQQSKANKTEDEASKEAVAKGEEKTYDKQEQEAQQKEEKEDEDSGLLFLDVDADVEEQAAKREERKKRAAAAGFFKKRRKNKLQQQNGKSSSISGDSSSEPPPLFPPIPPKLLRITLKAISEFGMINEGDKVLLGLSGGKDSLSLLHTLHAISQRPDFPSFSLGACTIDPQDQSYDPSPLIDYMRTLGIPYFFESQGLIEQAKCYGPTSICSWCSRMKRGLLYSCARREGYNVLALGQHLDDLAESFMMSALHNGQLRTMKACYMNDAGDIRIIRPFVYARERTLRDFALQSRFPVISENCPGCFEQPKERYRVKQLLTTQEHLFPNVYSNLLRTMKPLLEMGSEKMKQNEGGENADEAVQAEGGGGGGEGRVMDARTAKKKRQMAKQQKQQQRGGTQKTEKEKEEEKEKEKEEEQK